MDASNNPWASTAAQATALPATAAFPISPQLATPDARLTPSDLTPPLVGGSVTPSGIPDSASFVPSRSQPTIEPASLPSVGPTGSIAGDVVAWSQRWKDNDPVGYEAMKTAAQKDPTVLTNAIASDQAMAAQIGTQPLLGTDGAAYNDLPTYTWLQNRGLLPPGPSLTDIAASAPGFLLNAATGLAKWANLNLEGAGDALTGNFAQAQSVDTDAGNLLAAGVKGALNDVQDFAAGAGKILTGIFNDVDAVTGKLTPQQLQDLRTQGNWIMFRGQQDSAKATQATQDNLQEITSQSPADIATMLSGVRLAANPLNYVPVSAAFDAAAAVGSDVALTGLTEGLRMSLAKATAADTAARTAFDAISQSGGSAAAVQAATDAVAATGGILATAKQAFQDSVAADSAVTAKMLQAPLVNRTVGAAAVGVGKVMQLPAKGAAMVSTLAEHLGKAIAPTTPAVQSAVNWAAEKLGDKAVEAGAGAVGGEILSADDGHPLLGALAGVIGIQALKWAGSDLAAAGTQFALGRVALPYFARLAADTAATPVTRWVSASVLDPMTPWAAPFLSAASNAVKGAAAAAPIGAAYGAIQSGGTVSGAAAGAASVLPLGAVGGLAGSLTEAYARNSASATAAANVRYLQSRWAGDPVSTARFNQLTFAQQTNLAGWVHSNPDFTLLLNGQDNSFMKSQGALPIDASGDQGGGVSFKGGDGKTYVAISPNDPQAFGPVIAHELRHTMQMSDPALAQDVIHAAIGSPDLESPGMFTKFDPATGQPITIRNADGTLAYDTTDEFKAQKADYAARVSAATKQPYEISDPDFALERDAEESAQTWMNTDSFQQSVRPTATGILYRQFQNVPWLRSVLAGFGNGFDMEGNISEPGSEFAGTKATPETQQLVRDYTAAWSRRAPDAEEPEAPGIDLGPDAVQKNPALLTLLEGSMDMAPKDPKTGLPPGVAIDAQGNRRVVDPTKLFRKTAEVNADVARMRDAALAAVMDSVAKNPGLGADVVQPRTQADGTKVTAGRYFSPEQLAHIKASGTYNDIQFAQLANLNDLLKSGKSNFVRGLYQPALKEGRYAARAGHWVEEVPTGWKLTKDQNLTLQTFAPDKLARNLERLWSKPDGPARSAWGSTAQMYQDADQYIRDLAAGKSGGATIGVEKRNLINAALGLHGAGREEVNPVLKTTPTKGMTPAIVSRRLDRFNRLQPGLRADAPLWTNKTYEAAKQNFRPPEGAQQEGGDKHPGFPAMKAQFPGKALPHSVPEAQLNLIHFSGTPGLKATDPSLFGKSGTTNRSELAGGNKSYFFVEGSKYWADEGLIDTRPNRYVATVSGARIYDGNVDALGHGSKINKWRADEDLQKAGYVGIRRTSDDGRDLVQMFEPTAVRKFDGPLAKSKASPESTAPAPKAAPAMPRTRTRRIDTHYRPPEPNEESQRIAQNYMATTGRALSPDSTYAELPEAKLHEIADTFEAASHDPHDPAVKASYAALNDEVKNQYEAMLKAGIRVEPYTAAGEPYKDSAAMLADVREHKTLKVKLTETGFGEGETPKDHPMLEESGVTLDGHKLLNNDLFRAVHDYFGHTQGGYQFGPRGEFNAWKSHSRMFSEEAQGALAAETLAQNAWVNFGPHMRGSHGKVPAVGEEGFVAPADRRFADQKATIIPEEQFHSVRYRPPEAAQTDSPEFKSWFQGSRVVNDTGSPAVVYHGTGTKFTRFNLQKTTQGIIWFTNDKAAVENSEVGAQGHGIVMSLFASIKNPAGWDEYEKKSLGELKRDGYDGAILPDGDGKFSGFVFSPERLKSATTNHGTYDPKNPDIRYRPPEANEKLTVPSYVQGSWDPMAHTKQNDIWHLVQHELDLYEEGEDNDIKTPAKAALARKFLVDHPLQPEGKYRPPGSSDSAAPGTAAPDAPGQIIPIAGAASAAERKAAG